MKQFIFSLLVLICTIPSLASADAMAPIKKGDEGVVVADHVDPMGKMSMDEYGGDKRAKWVDVMNPDHTHSSSCIAEIGNSVTAIGLDNTGDRILIEYTKTIGSVGGSGPCISGTHYFVSTKEFRDMRDRRKRDEEIRIAREQRDKVELEMGRRRDAKLVSDRALAKELAK